MESWTGRILYNLEPQHLYKHIHSHVLRCLSSPLLPTPPLPPCVARTTLHVTVWAAVPLRLCRFLSASDFTLLCFPAESRSALFLSFLSMAALAAYIISTAHPHRHCLLLYLNRPAACSRSPQVERATRILKQMFRPCATYFLLFIDHIMVTGRQGGTVIRSSKEARRLW